MKMDSSTEGANLTDISVGPERENGEGKRSLSWAGLLFIILPLLLILVAAVYYMSHMWRAMSRVEMSTHGYVAMTLGIVFSLFLGIGLMMLAFYSSRSGHDDGASSQR